MPQHFDLQQVSPVPQQLVVLQEEKPKSIAAAVAVRMIERMSFICDGRIGTAGFLARPKMPACRAGRS